MATIKSFTSLEQSRKLAEILPLESADMHFVNDKHAGCVPYLEMTKGSNPWLKGVGVSPCWSLASLLSVLPDELGDNHFLTLDKEGNEYCCCYEDVNGNSFRHTFADNPVDACYEMIIMLSKNGLI